MRELTKQQRLVHTFFDLKGWPYEPGDQKSAILFRRYLRPANELLILCDGDLLKAVECVQKIKHWAESLSLAWSMETVAKKWHEIDGLKVEKKPYIDGDPAKKTDKGWMVLPYHGQWVNYDGPENKVEWR